MVLPGDPMYQTQQVSRPATRLSNADIAIDYIDSTRSTFQDGCGKNEKRNLRKGTVSGKRRFTTKLQADKVSNLHKLMAGQTLTEI